MASQAISTRSKLLVLVAVLASLLEIIDTSIVNVAIPTMMGNLGATLDEISWVVTGYIIANAIILPIASWMSIQFGRKLYYTGCILLFTLSSVACGLAPNLTTLVLFRIIQGFAGGALLPTSQALIYEAFPKEQAGMAGAIFGMSVMIGPTIGPTLGGYLTDNFGWRSIFNINLPIGLIVMILSWILVEDVGYIHNPDTKKNFKEIRKSLFKTKESRTPVDSLGLTLLILGIGCIQFVLERGHAEDWFDSKLITVALLVGSASLVGLIIWELKTPHPILELRHFKNPSFRSGVILMSGLGGMLYGLLFLVPVFASTILGMTATQTGELFIPGALAAAFAMPFIGNAMKKTDPRYLILIGIICLDLGMFFISRFNSQSSPSQMFYPLLIRGVAMSFLFVPINTSVLTQFSGAAIGQAAGMLNLCRQLGGSVTIAVLSTLFQNIQIREFSYLSEHITWFDQAANHAYALFAGGIHSQMQVLHGLGDPSLETIKILYLKTRKEAFVLAYQKSLLMVVVGFALTLIPLYFMKKPKIDGPIPTEH